MIAYYVHRAGHTRPVETIDPAWLEPNSGAVVWADVTAPTAEDANVLTETFKFHPLAVEDALQETH
ncbi:MAG TPA: hypothetical protein VEK56_16345, partial [Vicinamibacterales bacterium]|nr:hypothetical protein [Vicinamibacterales bacterium]